DVPPQTITKEKGVIGIDVNARPFHLALAEVSPDGNLQSYKSIYLSHLLKCKSRNRKEYEEWLIAHEVIKFAKEKGKAIAIEDIKNLPKGKRGDGKAKIRKILQFFSYRRILNKIESLANQEGIEIVKVNPAFTSVIGMMKYCPQYFIDKDVAGAYVIGRKALGFKEEIPENYKKLLKSQIYIQYALWRLGKIEEELKNKLNQEKNKYKVNGIKRDLRRLKKEKKFLERFLVEVSSKESSQSEPETQKQGHRRKEPCEGSGKRTKTLASSEGSLRYTSPWEVLCEGLLSFAPFDGAREVGGDSDQVRSCWLCRAALKCLRQSFIYPFIYAGDTMFLLIFFFFF
ncbi:MAG: IS200/IS605 family accessory protein TnpB-related protein, partial [Candidatus Calescibacterium sp.]